MFVISVNFDFRLWQMMILWI